MVRVIKERVTVQPGGLVELRSAELPPGLKADLTVVVVVGEPAEVNAPEQVAPTRDWRQFAGVLDSGERSSSNNEQIDADLAREYGSSHDQDE
jgi:hypothetical protein